MSARAINPELHENAKQRLKAFRSYAKCPVRSARYHRLTQAEVELIEVYIEQYGHLDYAGFNVTLRNFQDRIIQHDAKHLKDIWSMLSEANGVLYVPRRVKRRE